MNIEGWSLLLKSANVRGISDATGMDESRARLLPFIGSGLQNGISLTSACNNIGIPVAAISALAARDTGFSAWLEERARQAYTLLLNTANDLAVQKKTTAWLDLHIKIDNFRKPLVFWEQHCARTDVTPQAVLEAVELYGTPDIGEAATALGMLYPEYVKYVNTYPALKAAIEQNRAQYRKYRS